MGLWIRDQKGGMPLKRTTRRGVGIGRNIGDEPLREFLVMLCRRWIDLARHSVAADEPEENKDDENGTQETDEKYASFSPKLSAHPSQTKYSIHIS